MTNYSRGINGIMIDILGLPTIPTVGDFTFEVATVNSPGQWSEAPQPQSITVRQGAGSGGSSRVTVTWPDNSIQNTWLRVTVNSTAQTGLSTPDVFYFGNLLGSAETGSLDVPIGTTDQTAARNQPFTIANLAPITANADYDRDGLVNESDELIARDSLGHSLPPISIPGPAALPEREHPTCSTRAMLGFRCSLHQTW